MDKAKTIFRHDRNRPRNRYSEGTLEFEVSEIFYEASLELTGVAFSAVNKAFPKEEREKIPKLEYAWKNSHAQAKEFLTRYKNIVKDAIIPFAKLSKHIAGYDSSQDQSTKDFIQLIVNGQFYMLYDKLKDFGPLMLPAEDVEAYSKVLAITYEKVKEKLLENLSVYEAAPRFQSEEEYFK